MTMPMVPISEVGTGVALSPERPTTAAAGVVTAPGGGAAARRRAPAAAERRGRRRTLKRRRRGRGRRWFTRRVITQARARSPASQAIRARGPRSSLCALPISASTQTIAAKAPTNTGVAAFIACCTGCAEKYFNM